MNDPVTVVTGFVADDAGAGIDAATVRAVSLDADRAYTASIPTYQGKWVINNLPTDVDVWVAVYKPGRRQDGRVVHFTRSDCDRNVVDFKLPAVAHQLHPAYGTVYDRAGKPVPDVLVRVSALDPETPFTDYARTTATGTWALDVPSGPNFEVVVTGKGWQEQRQGGSLQTQPIEPVRIDFGGQDPTHALGPALPPCGPGPTAVITGTAPAYTLVRAISLDPVNPYMTTVVATLGRWSIPDFPASTNVWLSSAPGQGQLLNTTCEPHPFDLPGGKLAHPQTVIGNVYDAASKPIPDALIQVTAPGFEDYTRTTADGRWWLALPVDALLDITVTKPGYADATSRGISLTSPNVKPTLDFGGPNPTAPALINLP